MAGRQFHQSGDHQASEFTKTVRNNPLLERLSQTTNAPFPTFALNSHISAQKSSNIRAIYQQQSNSSLHGLWRCSWRFYDASSLY
jgi:hypothetical protein